MPMFSVWLVCGQFAHLYPFNIILAFGILCNFIALAFNGWRMPVIITDEMRFSDDFIHIKADQNVKLKFLVDRFVVRFFSKYRIFSIGDIFIWGGAIIFYIQWVYFWLNI